MRLMSQMWWQLSDQSPPAIRSGSLMKKLLSLVTVFAVVTPAFSQDMELVAIEEEANSIGWITFSGIVRNVGKVNVKFPRIFITLKRAGKVVAVGSSNIEGPDENILRPGQAGAFRHLTLMERSAFDEFAVVLDGRPDAVDPRFLTGELRLIEQSVNIDSTFGGRILILGELVNETNAVISEIEMRFAFFDSDDQFIGAATVFSFNLPGK